MESIHSRIYFGENVSMKYSEMIAFIASIYCHPYLQYIVAVPIAFSVTELHPVSFETLLVKLQIQIKASNINVKSLMRFRKGFALEITKKD